MIAYVDASVILRLVLNERGPRVALTRYDRAAASQLVDVECQRTIDRYRLAGLLDSAGVDKCLADVASTIGVMELVPVNPVVFELASRPMPTPVGALDAIHLASALLWQADAGEPVTLATHDGELATAARAMGLAVIGSPGP